MSEQENIQIVRRTFENLNKHDLDANDSLVANDVKTMGPGAARSMNLDEGRMYTKRFFDAFPDLRFDVMDIVAQGDKVAVSWVAKGTHKGVLVSPSGENIPPTNRTATTPGATFYEFRNNKIVRQDIYWDMVGLLVQLGVLSEQSIASRTR